MQLKDFLLVGCGGAIGSVLRYAAGLLVKPANDFPLNTWIVNLTGSFLIGWIASVCLQDQKPSGPLFLFFITGICGGFTTFSAFSWEGLQLLQQQKIILYLAYVISSILGGLFFVWLGMKMADMLYLCSK